MDKHTFLHKSDSHEKYKYFILLWILILTFIAGAVNVYSITKFKTPMTHYTGNSSLLAISITKTPNFKIIYLMLCFLLGSTFSGILFHEKNLKPKKRYGLTLFFMGIIVIFLNKFINQFYIIYILAIIVGMQNGLFIKFKGCMVRTTHVTGYLTDAGFSLGSIIRGKREQLWHLFFYIISIVFFILGGIFSIFILEYTKFPLEIIGILYIFAGLYYFILRTINLKKSV